MPRVPLRKLREREAKKRTRAHVSTSSRSYTVHEAPCLTHRASQKGGPLIHGGSGDNESASSSSSRDAIVGGVVLTKSTKEGSDVIFQRFYPSSSSKRARLKRDAKKLKELKSELDEALQMNERTGTEAIALGFCVVDGEIKKKQSGGRKSKKIKTEDGAAATRSVDTIPAKLCGFTADHLKAQEASNKFIVELRTFTRTYVECWEPLLHEDFREQLARRQSGLDRLKDTMGEKQVGILAPWWTGVRILDEGSRTTWQTWPGDATPSILIPFGPPVILETEYGSVELEEGHVCIFDASIEHRIVSTLRKRKKAAAAADGTEKKGAGSGGGEERPWCVCAHACRDMVGDDDDDEEEADELEEVPYIADKKRLLKNPPSGAQLDGQKARTVRT